MIEDDVIDFESKVLFKTDKGLKLSKDEIEDIRWNCEIVEETIIDEMRWQNEVEAVVQIGDRFFLVSWYSGKTEDQEDTFWSQKLIEVKKVEKTTIIETWEPIK